MTIYNKLERFYIETLSHLELFIEKCNDLDRLEIAHSYRLDIHRKLDTMREHNRQLH